MAAEHSADVDQFIRDAIDTVPHLEALLLTWRGRAKTWSETEMAAALYVPEEIAARILKDLEQKELLTRVPGEEVRYRYSSGSEAQDELMSRLNATYQRELIRISRMIHSKAPSGVREFARSFRFTKEEK
jgi:DNA-binding MarR family transcriptional regulator